MNNQFDDVNVVTGETVAREYDNLDDAALEVVDSGQMDRLTRTEIDVQIATAHRFPRSVTKFKSDALSLVTMDEETAASCFYKLPRGGKKIPGPSVRLAEIVGSCWGNMRYGARVVGEEKGFIIAQGVAHDLEKNVSSSIEVRRRITDKNGRLYNTDMIGVTANAACSIALRNAIFKVIPKTFVNTLYDAAVKVAVGDASTLSERRTKAFDYFIQKMGVSEERILNMLEKKGIADVDLDDLELLTGLKTALKEGDASIDATFPQEREKTKVSGDADALKKVETAFVEKKTTKKGTENKKKVEAPEPEVETPLPEVESDDIGEEVPAETEAQDDGGDDLFTKPVQNKSKDGPGGFGAEDLAADNDN